MPPQTVHQRLVISAISLIPFGIIAVLLMAVFYGSNGGLPLTGSAFGDAAAWVVAFAAYFGITYGLMFTKLEDVVPQTKK